MIEYSNPVLTGMYPDPSICRVGDDFYLVTSSFEYLPGIPVFHSRDLVHWTQIGHGIHRPEQLDIRGVKALGGIYAPTIRYHNGRFYIVTTLVLGRGDPGRNFYISAEDPAGPWLMPVFVEQSGIDPSLFFDKDGKTYLTSNKYGGSLPNPVIQQSEIDLETGELLTPPRIIAKGSGGACTEGPHLYYRNGYYYLFCAEGGTALGHMVTVFRAKTPWGPFQEACPFNPILTARDAAAPPLCATGHADLVTTQSGETWMVFLCYRHAFSKYHHLGRETALLPIQWDITGWPHVFSGKIASAHVQYPSAQMIESPPAQTTEWDNFSSDALAFPWNSVRHFPEAKHAGPHDGGLILQGKSGTLSDADCEFIAQRQRHFDCEIEVLMSFDAQYKTEEAGIAVRQSDDAHYAWVSTVRDGQPSVVLKRTVGDMKTESKAYPAASKLVLIIKTDRKRYSFGIKENDAVVWLESASTHLLSSEVNWGFTGVYIGMYATGNGQSCQNSAAFDYWKYTKLSHD